MACGTPVIALNRGAVPEIVVDGKTGFVVDSVDAMIDAVGRINSISPGECRRHVKNHFSITSMADKYSELYHHIIGSHNTSNTHRKSSTGHYANPVPRGMRAA